VVEQGRQVNDGCGAAGGTLHTLPRRGLNLRLRAPGWKTSGLAGPSARGRSPWKTSGPAGPGARGRSQWKTSGLGGPSVRTRTRWKTSGLEERARAREEAIPGGQADGEPETKRDDERDGESGGENEFQTHERRHSPERGKPAHRDTTIGIGFSARAAGADVPIKPGVIYGNASEKSIGFLELFMRPRTSDQERDFRSASHTRSTWSSDISGWIGSDRTSRAARSDSGKAPSRRPIQA